MAAYATLKAAIQAVIKQNGNNEITGPILQQALLSMINSLGDGYQFKGVATPATNPGTPDQNVFYIASEVGTYSNFGLSVGENEVALFLWDGSWSKQSIGAASAEAVNQLGQEVVKKTPGINLIDFDAADAQPNYYINSSGVVSVGNSNYWLSGMIPIKPSTAYSFTDANNSYPGGSGYINFYDSEKNFISTIRSNGFTTPATAAYVRLTVYQHPEGTMLNEGACRLAPFKEYNPIGKYTEAPEQESDIVKRKPSKNLFDSKDIMILFGQYLTSAGVPAYGNVKYSVSGFIAILPDTQYCWSNASDVYPGASGYIAFYDASYSLVGTPVNTKVFTTPAAAQYVRVTLHSDYGIDVMLNKGNSRGEYEEYNPVGGYVNLMGKKQWDGIVGLPMLRESGSLADGGDITITDYPYYVKSGDNIAFYGEFSSFGTLLVGKGYGVGYGIWIKIDTTNVTIVKYANGAESNVDVQAHGLTFNTFVKVLVSSKNDGTLVYIVQTLGGYFRYEYSHTLWNGMGSLFVKASGMSLSNCKLSASNSNYKKPIWCYGDSYFAWDSTRWPYYLYTWGFKNYILDALSGGGSSQLLPDFAKGLNYGCPKFAFWCMGMNDGSDTDADNPSSAWLTAVQSFIQTCEENGIIPILATIPTVPTVNNEGKTAWVRNSGYRYVDFYKAVGANSSGVWYSGYLSNDGVHPSQLGGQALATQVLIDFPEIMG